MGRRDGTGNDQESLQEALRLLRAQHRELQEELEATVEDTERASRTIDEVVLEYLWRGDLVRVWVGERNWTGTVVHVGAEVMTLTTSSGTEVDLDYEGLSAIRVAERRREGGRTLLARHPETLLARLRELAVTGEEVELGGRSLPTSLVGCVEAVGRGHLELRSPDGGEWVVPVREVTSVLRRLRGERSRRRS